MDAFVSTTPSLYAIQKEAIDELKTTEFKQFWELLPIERKQVILSIQIPDILFV